MHRAMLAVLAAVTAVAGSPASAATRAFPVGGFDRIASSSPFDVRVHTGGAPAVRAEGSQEALDRLRVEVHGGELVIATARGAGGWFSGWGMHTQHAVIDVTVPMIAAARLSGPGDLSVDRVHAPRFEATLSGPGDIAIGMVETGQLTFTLSGPGNITAAGRAGTAAVTLSGPGDIRAAKLMTRDATVMLSGPGDVALSASGTVRGRLSGPGDITITGGARCDIVKHGPGDVHCR